MIPEEYALNFPPSSLQNTLNLNPGPRANYLGRNSSIFFNLIIGPPFNLTQSSLSQPRTPANQLTVQLPTRIILHPRIFYRGYVYLFRYFLFTLPLL